MTDKKSAFKLHGVQINGDGKTVEIDFLANAKAKLLGAAAVIAAVIFLASAVTNVSNLFATPKKIKRLSFSNEFMETRVEALETLVEYDRVCYTNMFKHVLNISDPQNAKAILAASESERKVLVQKYERQIRKMERILNRMNGERK